MRVRATIKFQLSDGELYLQEKLTARTCDSGYLRVHALGFRSSGNRSNRKTNLVAVASNGMIKLRLQAAHVAGVKFHDAPDGKTST